MIADDLFQQKGLVINQGKTPVEDLPVGNEFMRGFQGIADLPRKWIKPLKYGQGMGKQVIKGVPLADMCLFMFQYIVEFIF